MSFLIGLLLMLLCSCLLSDFKRSHNNNFWGKVGMMDLVVFFLERDEPNVYVGTPYCYMKKQNDPL